MSRLPGGAHYRVEIMIVGAAAAEIAGHRVARLLARRLRIDFEQAHRRHDLARRAEAALRSKLFDESLLHRMEFAVRAFQPFDGGYPAPAQRVGQCRAGVMRKVIDE